MAKNYGQTFFTGSVHNLTFYKRRDMDVPLVRQKGGPSTKDLKTHPRFANTRLNNMEFGGRSAATKWILNAIGPLRQLCDFNIAGPLNSLLKPIQVLDTAHPVGQRSIDLALNPGLLEGFQLNRKNLFEAVFTNSLAVNLSKENLTATIQIPELIPGSNFFPVGTYPVYRWEAALGFMGKFTYYDTGKRYSYDSFYSGSAAPGVIATPWTDVHENGAPQTLNVKIDYQPAPEDTYTCILTVGISFGVKSTGDGKQMKYAGAGKILKIV